MKSEEIFDMYLDDKCPVCHNYIDQDSDFAHVESGGKCMAKHFICGNCGSEYTVGFMRNRMPINSCITLKGMV